LEEDWNHVDRDEDRCSSRCSHGEENEHCARGEELDRENTAGLGGEESVNLLYAKDCEKNTRADK